MKLGSLIVHNSVGDKVRVLTYTSKNEFYVVDLFSKRKLSQGSSGGDH